MAKKFLGFFVIVLGILMILASLYIKVQVGKGKYMVSSAEEKIEAGKTLFSLSPATKEIGKGITRGAERKIEEGKGEISKYETISNYCLGGGIVLFILGTTIIIISKRKIKK